jgi:lambda family phage portal protein
MKMPAFIRNMFGRMFPPGGTPRRATRRYHGAEESRLTGAWFPGGQDQNRLIAYASPLLRARVRDLVRNFPPFARAVDGVVAFTVGRGSRFQSLAVDTKGHPDLKLRRKIESRFRSWMDEADITRKLHYYELKQLAARQDLESGEHLARFVTPRNRSRHPFALMMHESENFADAQTIPASEGVDVFQGIEFDTSTGEVLGYHLQENAYSLLGTASSSWRPWREPADNVVHGFRVLRPGQQRGVTPFAPAILCAKDMSDYTVAELGVAKLAAKWLAFVTSPDPAGMQGFGSLPGNTNKAEVRDEIEGIEDLPDAIIEYLNVGEDVKFSPGSSRPGDSHERFTRIALRFVSIVAPLPYEILSGDYTDINYTTSKASRNDYAQILAPHKFRYEQHWDRRIFFRWLDHEALTQDYLPGYFADPGRYRASMWIPAGMPSVDPLRDGKADIDAVRALLKSPQQVILSRGDDPDEVLMQWVDWIHDCQALGLDPFQAAGIDTSLANNPAKLGAPEEFEG